MSKFSAVACQTLHTCKSNALLPKALPLKVPLASFVAAGPATQPQQWRAAARTAVPSTNSIEDTAIQ